MTEFEKAKQASLNRELKKATEDERIATAWAPYGTLFCLGMMLVGALLGNLSLSIFSLFGILWFGYLWHALTTSSLEKQELRLAHYIDNQYLTELEHKPSSPYLRVYPNGVYYSGYRRPYYNQSYRPMTKKQRKELTTMLKKGQKEFLRKNRGHKNE